jgi:hypothetical protein
MGRLVECTQCWGVTHLSARTGQWETRRSGGERTTSVGRQRMRTVLGVLIYRQELDKKWETRRSGGGAHNIGATDALTVLGCYGVSIGKNWMYKPYYNCALRTRWLTGRTRLSVNRDEP